MGQPPIFEKKNMQKSMSPGQTKYDYLKMLLGSAYKPGMSKHEMVRLLSGNPKGSTDSNSINSLFQLWASPPGKRGISTDGFTSWDWLRILIGPLFEPGKQ